MPDKPAPTTTTSKCSVFKFGSLRRSSSRPSPASDNSQALVLHQDVSCAGHGRARRRTFLLYFARGPPLQSDGERKARRQAMSQEWQEVLYAVEDRVATITLNRPEKLNAYTEVM